MNSHYLMQLCQESFLERGKSGREEGREPDMIGVISLLKFVE